MTKHQKYMLIMILLLPISITSMLMVFVCDIFTFIGKAVTEMMMDIIDKAEEIVIGNDAEG